MWGPSCQQIVANYTVKLQHSFEVKLVKVST